MTTLLILVVGLNIILLTAGFFVQFILIPLSKGFAKQASPRLPQCYTTGFIRSTINAPHGGHRNRKS